MDGFAKIYINRIISSAISEYKLLENQGLRSAQAWDNATNEIEKIIDRYYIENPFRDLGLEHFNKDNKSNL